MAKCSKCGHNHAGPGLANICVGCPCPETRFDEPSDLKQVFLSETEVKACNALVPLLQDASNLSPLEALVAAGGIVAHLKGRGFDVIAASNPPQGEFVVLFPTEMGSIPLGGA
jgi:hypothetical protein